LFIKVGIGKLFYRQAAWNDLKVSIGLCSTKILNLLNNKSYFCTHEIKLLIQLCCFVQREWTCGFRHDFVKHAIYTYKYVVPGTMHID